MLESHPDKGGDSDKFKLIREAYDIMKDDVQKKEYDNKLMYYQEMYDRAEEINLQKNIYNFKCIQCEKNNEINKELVKKQNNFYLIFLNSLYNYQTYLIFVEPLIIRFTISHISIRSINLNATMASDFWLASSLSDKSSMSTRRRATTRMIN